MAQAKGKGGCGSAIGCIVVLGLAGLAVWHFFPQIRTWLPGRSEPVAWGEAHLGGGLRVRVRSAGVEMTEIEDALGAREGSLDLHVTLEVTNMGDTPLLYKTPRLLGASESKLLDDRGRDVQRANYSDEVRIEGQLNHGQEIEPHDSETHDLLFKVPPPDAKSFLLNVDMAMFGSRGVVQFRIPAEKITGLR